MHRFVDECKIGSQIREIGMFRWIYCKQWCGTCQVVQSDFQISNCHSSVTGNASHIELTFDHMDLSKSACRPFKDATSRRTPTVWIPQGYHWRYMLCEQCTVKASSALKPCGSRGSHLTVQQANRPKCSGFLWFLVKIETNIQSSFSGEGGTLSNFFWLLPQFASQVCRLLPGEIACK